MNSNILYEFTFGLFLKLAEMAQILLDFLFSYVIVLDIKFQVWQLIGGGVFITLLVAWLVKKLVPVL